MGNLRTALVAWLMARGSGRRFLVRIEDLDVTRVRAGGDLAAQQLRDLAALGLDWDGEVVRQSERIDLYREAVARLEHYPCFCTRREIAESASASHADGYRPYPGTCRALSAVDRAARGRIRPPALRVDAGGAEVTVPDRWAGSVTGVIDDFVIRRNDGAYAYNLACVVDDLAQGVDQVVRGDDLLSGSPRQAWLLRQLGGTIPEYAHVPLVVNGEGRRLAKRDGAVTLADLAEIGRTPAQVLSLLGQSLGINEPGEPVTPGVLLGRWDPAAVPREPWVFR